MAIKSKAKLAAQRKGARAGRGEVRDMLREQGLGAVLGTLRDGHVAWDEGAINAGAAEIEGIPSRLEQAYYRAYAAAAAAEVDRLSRQRTKCPCGKRRTRHVVVRGSNAGKSWDECPCGESEFL